MASGRRCARGRRRGCPRLSQPCASHSTARLSSEPLQPGQAEHPRQDAQGGRRGGEPGAGDGAAVPDGGGGPAADGRAAHPGDAAQRGPQGTARERAPPGGGPGKAAEVEGVRALVSGGLCASREAPALPGPPRPGGCARPPVTQTQRFCCPLPGGRLLLAAFPAAGVLTAA